MGIVRENAKFPRQWNRLSTERENKNKKQKMSAEKKNRGYKKSKQTSRQTKNNNNKTGSTDFSSAPNTLGTIEVRSHAAIARFSRGVGGGGMPPDPPPPPRFFNFSFESVPMPEVNEGLIPTQGYFLFCLECTKLLRFLQLLFCRKWFCCNEVAIVLLVTILP